VNDTKDSEADLVICVSKNVSDPNHPKVIIDNKLNVTGTGQPNGYSITGISLCSPSLFDEEERSKKMGIHHFLEFLLKLVIGKYTVKAYKFPEVIDVNRYEDLKKAEEFLKKL
jgi:NDP-sugar pyrophosphorylase family protein